MIWFQTQKFHSKRLLIISLMFPKQSKFLSSEFILNKEGVVLAPFLLTLNNFSPLEGRKLFMKFIDD